MKTLFLHIGTHKTGTSALQHFFLTNREILEKHGVYYPRTGCNREGMHHPLFLPLDTKNITQSKRTFSSMVDELKQEIGEKQQVLISSEMISKLISRKDFHAKSLFELFDTVKIIVYVRRPDDFIESAYRQQIKIRRTYSFDSCYEEHKRRNDIYMLCRKCSNFVGKDNVIVRCYEKNQFVGGTIFNDFLECIGLKMTGEYTLPSRNINVSLGLDALLFKRAYNDLPSSIIEKRAVARMLETYMKQKPATKPRQRILSPQQRLDIIKEFEDGNRRVALEFLGRPEGRLFYDPLPDASSDWNHSASGTGETPRAIFLNLLKQSSWKTNYDCLIKPLFKGFLSPDKRVRKSAIRIITASSPRPDQFFSN